MTFRTTPLLLALLIVRVCHAENVVATLDAGGGRSTGASYVNDASIGAISGNDSGISATIKAGYVGQLTEVSSVSATGTPAQVGETATTQLGGAAVLDDDTVTVLTGADINWNIPSWPIQSISASGVATAATVYADTSGTINGSYLGVPGSGSVLVLDSQPDNYGSYAGDGLPDWWQHQYFGLDNPDAAPERDLFGTGESNLFKYVAGLDPTNATSVFHLRIEPVPGQPGQANLVFSPRWTNRTYTPLFCTNLIGCTEGEDLFTGIVSDNGTERTLTDTNAIGRARFYRVKIAYP